MFLIKVVSLLLFLSLLLSGVLVAGATPAHASLTDAGVRAMLPQSWGQVAVPVQRLPLQPTAVTLSRLQATPGYPLFGIVGSLILIALVLMYRVYRSI